MILICDHLLTCFTHILCTAVPQIIKHKGLHAVAKLEWLGDCATHIGANHEHTRCHKKPLSMQDGLSLLNNKRIPWLLATVVHIADQVIIDHSSSKVVGGAEYR